MKIIFKKIFTYLIRFFELQFFLTLASLPLLVFWGLPLSYAAPLANLIFAPFITLFLFLSSLIFFMEICHTPNHLLIKALEELTTLWHQCITWSSAKLLICLPYYMLLIVWIMPFIAWYILRIRTWHTKYILFSICFIGLWILHNLVGHYFTYTNASLPLRHKQIECRKEAGELLLMDNGCFNLIKNGDSFAQFKILPTLTMKFGTLCIDHVVCSTLSLQALKTLLALTECVEIKNLYIPAWQGKTEKRFFSFYKALVTHMKKNGGTLHLIKKSFSIGQTQIMLSSKWLRYKDMFFYGLYEKREKPFS